MKNIDWSKAPEGATHKDLEYAPRGFWYKFDFEANTAAYCPVDESNWIPGGRASDYNDGSMDNMAARATSSLCPGHGRAQCVSCCWPTAEQSAGYTAVDMSTAAADGYRDGKASFEVELEDPYEYSGYSDEEARGASDFYTKVVAAIIAAGGKVK
jgi:hypothetical protein